MLSYLVLGLSLATAVVLVGVGIARHQPVAIIDTATAQNRCCAPKSPNSECRPC